MKIALEDGTKITAQELWESNLKSNPLYIKLLNQNDFDKTHDPIYDQVDREIKSGL